MKKMLPSEVRGWRRWGGLALDLLYPPCCAICERLLTQGRALCDACDADFPRLGEPHCAQCGEMFEGAIEGSFQCPNCRNLKFAFEFARPATPRDERILDMIHRLKYNRELHLARELGCLAADAFDDPRLAAALRENWPLVPVPLHRGRSQHRHFNQAEEIAKSLSRYCGLPIVNALRRIRRTEHQTTLTRAQRMDNLRGAFTLSSQGLKRSEQLAAGAVIIDDVFTTGSTANACAKILRHAGVRRVAVVTVMRG